MPGRKKARKWYFKPGNTYGSQYWQGVSEKKADQRKEESHPFTRLSATQYEDLVTVRRDGTLSLHDVDGNPAPVRLLRPVKPKATVQQPESDGKPPVSDDVYKLHHQGKLLQFFNDCFQEHAETSAGCDGRLVFDPNKEEKRGLCWKEEMKCEKCSYHPKKTKLYTEVTREGPGCKAAVPNVAIQVGLSQTMISNVACRRILMSAHIPVPATSGMQKHTNSVHDKIVEANRGDMARRQAQLHENNQVMGLPRDAPIRVEGDGRYNNPLYSGAGKTPFQAGTQAVYTVVENQTKSKQVIAVATKNKLCTTAQRLRNKGQRVTCPDHHGHCSASAPPNSSIGDEADLAQACVLEMQQDNEPTRVKYCILDGDSRALKGFQPTSETSTSDTPPLLLKDTRHLSLGQKRALAKVSWSSGMFPRHLKIEKEKLINRFNEDVKRQCAMTLSLCYDACAGDVNKMIKKLTYATDAMIDCYNGNHDLCKRGKSFTCQGTKRHHWNKPMLPEGYRLHMTDEDKDKLRQCIGYKLDRNAVLSQQFNSNSQKAEAVNRTYTSTNPKCVTMTRNFSGRIHSAVHKVNNGPGQSTVQLLEHVGASLPHNSRVRCQLKSEDAQVKKRKDSKKTIKSKQNRIKTVLRNYQMYDSRPEKVVYKKGMHDKLPQKSIRCPPDHNYNKK